MKISIITPVKNLERYISETIESVINQRGNFDLEYIIINGGSTDNSLKICEDYRKQIQTNSRPVLCNSIDFKIISEPDFGMYDALSKGLKLVTGEIVCYINADDLYLPNAFSCISEIFLKYNSIEWLIGSPIRFNEQGQIIEFFVPWQYNSELITKGFNGNQLSVIQQESVFWRRNLNNLIDFEKMRHFRFAGDYFLWYTFAKQKTKLYVVDSFLGGNRLRKGQLSEDKKNYYKEINSIKDKSNLFDLVKVFFYWIMERFAGAPVKRRSSINRIRYQAKSWKVQ